MIIYTIQKGDSLWKIARHYRISLDALLILPIPTTS